MSTEKFGEYELLRYLTAGGMADLYLARRPGSDEDLVLKRIQTRYLDHTRVVKLFIDEGRIAKTLNHPNVVRVVDVGNLGGTYYIAMEYIPGHDLIAIARRGVETGKFLPRAVAVGIVAQVATGLAFAHSRSDEEGKPLAIVHCDISPGNVVVSWRGTAKIVDFGIARATIALREEEHVAGKYNYMSPEQIRGGQIDARADLFALGVILYELTLGKRLFKGRPEVVRRKVLDGRIPRPRELAADYPEPLERILSRMLARDPDQRYPSAAALRSDLRSYLSLHEDGWTKKEIARYLRDLFRASRDITASDEFNTGDDEELVLERAMPHLAEEDQDVEADPDEADEESATFSDAFALGPLAAPTVVDPVIPTDPTPPLILEMSVTPQLLADAAIGPAITEEMPAAPAITEEMAAAPAITEEMPVAPAITEEMAAAPAITEDMAAAPAITQEMPAAPAITEEMPAAPAITEEMPAAPAITEEMAAAPAITEEMAAAPAIIDDNPTAPIAVDVTPPPAPADETSPNAIGPEHGLLRVGEISAPAPPRRQERPLGHARGVEIGGETAQVRLPDAPRRSVGPGDAPTALVRLPDEQRRREAMRAAMSTEATTQVHAPRPRRRRRSRVSSGVVIGGCMVVAAAVLLTLFLFVR